MNPQIEKIIDIIGSWDHLPVADKNELLDLVKKFNRELEILEFKLERTEKVKRTSAILLEETIEELEQKRKAVEIQNRDLEIEAALEKVRSRMLRMEKSSDLEETTTVMYQQLDALGVVPEGSLVSIVIVDTNTDTSIQWIVADGTLTKPAEGEIRTTMTKVPQLKKTYDAWKRQDPLLIRDLSGDELEDFKKYLNSLPSFREAKFEVDLWPDRIVWSEASFSYGTLGIIYTMALPAETLEILVQFSKVFDLTYTRFLDIQKTEAQAREVIRQTSLDRVRGEIASMRSTDDLERITPLVFNELTTLGVPFIRCGVFIIHSNEEFVEVYLSSPDGHPLGVLNFSFGSNELTTHAVEYWRKKKVYHKHWKEIDFIKWTKYLIDIGQVESQKVYQGSETPPESLDLHFIPFEQGMLYVGNSRQLSKEEIDLVKSLAEAFSMAYSRYEDFAKLETAVLDVEKTLNELKAAQKQLIHSEKMASLGELTAGIAHEIKNPLNFVNNFSEVSKELLEEMKEELDVGHFEEVKEIADDVISNLEKITHHGQRADSIVKGMLQHSRTNTGEKEAVDINNLVDEYLRLAYHGMRAKDKSFNVTLETHYDDSIGKVIVIPQDMGRVVLNLITNAFYACTERRLSADHTLAEVGQGNSSSEIREDGSGNYKPLVIVSTQKFFAEEGQNGERKIEITVKDNGNGIPQKVLDKIFQPFFTTKPTGKGTGLGLSLSYDIVKAQGGKLRVETKEGVGSEFIIEIPIGELKNND